MSNTNHAFTRQFGIELEFLGNGYAAADRVNASTSETVSAEGYNHRTRSYWKVVPDCSVRTNMSASRGSMDVSKEGELVSPILKGEAGVQRMRDVVTAFENGADMRVNRSCGFHAHFDVSDLTLPQFKRFAKMWVKYEDVFDCFVSKSRREGAAYGGMIMTGSNLRNFRHYGEQPSAENDAKAAERAFAAIDACTTIEQVCNLWSSRYVKMNFQAYFRAQTVECRMHQGTLNAEKIEAWIRLINWLIESAKSARYVAPRKVDGKEGKARFSSFFYGRLDKAVVKYLKQRAKDLA